MELIDEQSTKLCHILCLNSGSSACATAASWGMGHATVWSTYNLHCNSKNALLPVEVWLLEILSLSLELPQLLPSCH